MSGRVKHALETMLNECKNELARGNILGYDKDGPHFHLWNKHKKMLEEAIEELNEESGNVSDA